MVSSQHRLPDRPGDSNLFKGQDPGRGRRLGIDVGSVRIGVAASDPDGILATPVETVRRDRTGKHLRRLAALATELEAVEVIVGLPRTLADRTGPSAQDAIELAGKLAEVLAHRVAPTPVRLADERLTTVSAQRSLRAAGVRAKDQRAVIDQAAAVAILQSWLDQRRAALAGSESARRGIPPMVDSVRPERAEPEAVGPPRHKMSRLARKRAERGHRRRRFAGRFALGLLIVVVVAAVVVGFKLWHTVFGTGDDYTGPGKQDIMIQIHAGDSTTAIGETLHDHGVVATVRAFVNAAHGVTGITSIQPGFYRTRTEIPAASAVARLVDPNNRVGKLVIPEGRQLDDTTDMKTNKVNPGIFTLISRRHLRGPRR